MSTDDDENTSSIDPDDHSEDLNDADGESRTWMWIYYDRRKDAYRAIRAADRLGIGCTLSSRWVSGPDQTETQEWVVELRTTGGHPSLANSSMTRLVE